MVQGEAVVRSEAIARGEAITRGEAILQGETNSTGRDSSTGRGNHTVPGHKATGERYSSPMSHNTCIVNQSSVPIISPVKYEGRQFVTVVVMVALDVLPEELS